MMATQPHVEGILHELSEWTARTGHYVTLLENNAVLLANGKMAVNSVAAVLFVSGEKDDGGKYNFHTPCPATSERIKKFDAEAARTSSATFTAPSKMPDEHAGSFIPSKFQVQAEDLRFLNSLSQIIADSDLRSDLIKRSGRSGRAFLTEFRKEGAKATAGDKTLVVTNLYTNDAATVLDQLNEPRFQCNHPPGAHAKIAGGRDAKGDWASAEEAAYPDAFCIRLAMAFTMARTGSSKPIASCPPAPPVAAPVAAPTVPIAPTDVPTGVPAATLSDIAPPKFAAPRGLARPRGVAAAARRVDAAPGPRLARRRRLGAPRAAALRRLGLGGARAGAGAVARGPRPADARRRGLAVAAVPAWAGVGRGSCAPRVT